MKRVILIIISITIYINLYINIFGNDKCITNKIDKFIINNIDSKYILEYIDYNYSNIEDKNLKQLVVEKFIKYNEENISMYQFEFDNMYVRNVTNLQTKQNLKSELILLNKVSDYSEFNQHRFNFTDNKPNIVNNLVKIYTRGYKVILENNKFKIKVNYKIIKEMSHQ